MEQLSRAARGALTPRERASPHSPPARSERAAGAGRYGSACGYTRCHTVYRRGTGGAKAGLVYGGPRSALCRLQRSVQRSASGPRGGPAHGPAQRQSAEPDVACVAVVRTEVRSLSVVGAARVLRFILLYFWGVSGVTRLVSARTSQTRIRNNARRVPRVALDAPRPPRWGWPGPDHAPESPDGDYRFFVSAPLRRGAPPRRTAQGTLGLTAASATLHLPQYRRERNPKPESRMNCPARRLHLLLRVRTARCGSHTSIEDRPRVRVRVHVHVGCRYSP